MDDNSFDPSKRRPFGRQKINDGKHKFNSFEVFDLREESNNFNTRRPLDEFPVVRDEFDNSVGQDFGSVFYDFEENKVENSRPHSFLSFKKPNRERANESPRIPPQSPAPSRRRPSSPTRPSRFSPSKPFSTSFSKFGNSGGPSQSSVQRLPSRDPKSGCTKYTETICLDAQNYPQ